MPTKDDGSMDDFFSPESRLRRRVEEAKTAEYTRELEEKLKKLTPEEVDNNLLEAQLAYRVLSKGEYPEIDNPAERAWVAHLREHGELLPDDPYDTPNGYTYEMALGYREFCRRWEASRTFLGRALGRVCDEAGRLGLLDSPGAVEDLRRKVIQEVTTLGARHLVEGIAGTGEVEEPAPVSVPPIVVPPGNRDLEYGADDVRAEAYGTPIGKLKKNDLIPISDVNDLPELCRVIEIMRLLVRTRAAVYNALSRMTNLELERGGRAVSLGEWDIPRPIEAKGRHKTWSKSEVIRWKAEREQWKQIGRRRRDKT